MRRALSGLAVAVVAGGLMAGGLAGPAAAAAGATVYAAPAGVGSDCSAAAPCSLDSAVSQANAASGDTVVLADGSYPGVAVHLQASMSLTAAPGARPVLHGDGTGVVVEADAGTVSVSGLTVTGGAIGIGAGPSAGPLTVTGSTISGNSSYGVDADTQTTVAGSTIAANGAVGFLVGSLGDGQAISVTNTTIAGNDGSGIELSKGSASVTLTGVTISGNGHLGLAEQGISESGDSVSLGSSLIAGNGTGCFFDRPPADAGYNVESDDSCGLGPASRTNAGDAAIGLGPLAANGRAGPPTQAIGPSSAAYQVVPAGSALCPSADERGVPRPGSGTTACDAGAYEYHAPVALTQAAPALGTVTAGTAFAVQLAVTGATGAVTYTTTSPAGPVTVSSTGAVTAPASTPAGVYQLTGTDTDPLGDTGTWAFTVSVTTPGPARADLSLALNAPAQASAGGSVAVTLTLRDAGPSAAAKTGTALLIPRGWTVASSGGGTLIGRQILTFTASTVAAGGTLTYHVTLTAPTQAKGRAVLAAATASVTQDPSYRNNVAAALVQLR